MVWVIGCGSSASNNYTTQAEKLCHAACTRVLYCASDACARSGACPIEDGECVSQCAGSVTGLENLSVVATDAFSACTSNAQCDGLELQSDFATCNTQAAQAAAAHPTPYAKTFCQQYVAILTGCPVVYSMSDCLAAWAMFSDDALGRVAACASSANCFTISDCKP